MRVAVTLIKMKTKIFKEIETLDEALKDFPSIYNFREKVNRFIDYIHFPLKIQIGDYFVTIDNWFIKSACKGNFGGYGGYGKYFSWKGIKLSIGKV